MTQIRLPVLPADLAKTDKSQTWTGTQDFTGATVLGVAGPGGASPDATTTSKGLVQLAGDLAGTAAAPTVAKINGATPAPVATSGSYADLTGKPTIPTVAAAGTAGAALAATDPTTTNARTPIAHAASHAAGGTDPVTVAAGQVTGLAPVATSGSYTDLSNRPAAGASVQFVAKAVQTDRTSTTAVALDPELVATVTTGTYLLELFGAFTSGSTGGLALALGGTATRGTASGGLIHTASGNPYQFAAFAWSGAATPTVFGTASSPTSAAVTARILVPVTAAGTLGLSWAQGQSSSITTSLLPGSSLTLTKIA